MCIVRMRHISKIQSAQSAMMVHYPGFLGACCEHITQTAEACIWSECCAIASVFRFACVPRMALHPGFLDQARCEHITETAEACVWSECGASPSYYPFAWVPRMVLYPGFLDQARCEHVIKMAKARLRPSSLALRKTDTADKIRCAAAGVLVAAGRPCHGVYNRRCEDVLQTWHLCKPLEGRNFGTAGGDPCLGCLREQDPVTGERQ